MNKPKQNQQTHNEKLDRIVDVLSQHDALTTNSLLFLAQLTHITDNQMMSFNLELRRREDHRRINNVKTRKGTLWFLVSKTAKGPRHG